MQQAQAKVIAFTDRYAAQMAKTAPYAALDLASEVGELAKLVLSATNYGRQPDRLELVNLDPAVRDRFADEIGDVLYSLLDLANLVGVDASQALAGALAKYEARLAARGRASSS